MRVTNSLRQTALLFGFLLTLTGILTGRTGEAFGAEEVYYISVDAPENEAGEKEKYLSHAHLGMFQEELLDEEMNYLVKKAVRMAIQKQEEMGIPIVRYGDRKSVV